MQETRSCPSAGNLKRALGPKKRFQQTASLRSATLANDYLAALAPLLASAVLGCFFSCTSAIPLQRSAQ